MKDLIEALTILMKYAGAKGEEHAPTHCEHDVLYVAGIGVDSEDAVVSEEDRKRLDALGFYWDEECECFASFRFGSC